VDLGGDRVKMEQNAKINILNLGCGLKKFIGGVNVDAFKSCEPDIVWDLNKTPWTWAEDSTYDRIFALHIFEHLVNWWDAVIECSRILKVGGILEIRCPDPSSDSSLTYRDHVTMISPLSFHGIMDGNGIVPFRSGTNAWALTQENTVPLKAVFFARVPFPRYDWMNRKGLHWLLTFCARHMNNFIWEQVLIFEKINGIS